MDTSSPTESANNATSPRASAPGNSPTSPCPSDEILLECENRQRRFVSEVPPQSNLVQHSSGSDSMLAPPTGSMPDSQCMSAFSHSGRKSYRGRGQSNYGRPQCQICGRLRHLAQRCYYRFNHSIDGLLITSFGHSSSVSGGSSISSHV
ncbi:hypothetical protein GOBAR_DD19090 [Gossypium barbadense]|nr:hypothetical protein GOBAR_DD19090 [Gossypium barbadense]